MNGFTDPNPKLDLFKTCMSAMREQTLNSLTFSTHSSFLSDWLAIMAKILWVQSSRHTSNSHIDSLTVTDSV